MKLLNASPTQLLEAAFEQLKSEGKLNEPLSPVIWPKPEQKVLDDLHASQRLRLVHDLLRQILDADNTPRVLELFRREEFEIEVCHHELRGLHQFQKYVFTSRGPLMRLYALQGRAHAPKKHQAPEHEIPVSLEEFLVRADSVMDFHNKLVNFIGSATNKILHRRPRRAHHHVAEARP